MFYLSLFKFRIGSRVVIRNYLAGVYNIVIVVFCLACYLQDQSN